MVKIDLSSFNNNWYRPGTRLKILLWYIANHIFFNTYISTPNRLKYLILKAFGAVVSRNVVIKPNVNIKYPWLLTIGENAWIGENVWIDNLAQVTISSNVCVSQGAMLLCGNHNYKKSAFDLMVGEIILEDGVWIGAKSVVCPGVTCKSHSILTVGSIATKDLEAYSIYQGNPAVKIKDRIITK